MTRALLVVHQARPEASELAAEVGRWLFEQGHEVALPDGDAAIDGLEAATWAPTASGEVASSDDLGLVVSLGGDGTVLRSVELTASLGAPILGVNLGQLGYLTEVEPPGVQVALERFFAGEHGIEDRMLLQVLVSADESRGLPRRVLALNEATVEKSLTGHTIRLDVAVGGRYFTPYEVDAMIVATPTGSTAHAFSARGPIVAPTHRLVLLTPVSPHMLFDRTLVLEPESDLTLTVAGHRSAALVTDGRLLGELLPGDAISCRAAPERARLVTFGPRDFAQILKAKFKLSDR